MNLTALRLTEQEVDVLKRCADLEITKRGIQSILIIGSMSCISLVMVGSLLKSWLFVMALALLYMVITVWEKISYGKAVLLYKSLVQKLERRVNELEN